MAIIQIAIIYHEAHEERRDGKVDPSALLSICEPFGINQDNPLFERIEKIAFALKDADALDRTRFRVRDIRKPVENFKITGRFTRPEHLHYDFSKSLIKLGEQLNECYANRQIKALGIVRKPDETPKETVKNYMHNQKYITNESEEKRSGK